MLKLGASKCRKPVMSALILLRSHPVKKSPKVLKGSSFIWFGQLLHQGMYNNSDKEHFAVVIRFMRNRIRNDRTSTIYDFLNTNKNFNIEKYDVDKLILDYFELINRIKSANFEFRKIDDIERFILFCSWINSKFSRLAI